MSYNDITISITEISKCFYIYENPHDRLKQFIVPKFQMLLGLKEKQFYDAFWALKNISFDIYRGQTVGLIGRNGSGKSTLLQIICGTLSATSGNVKKHGRIAALLELGSGFNHEFSGLENIYLNASILGLTKEETDSRLEEIISFADIGKFIHQPVKTYSSGMTVRLAFAVQAQIDPDILIVDEALAVGDARFQAKCFDRLKQLKANGTSILLVSHSGEQIVTHCDYAVLLNNGENIYEGQPKIAVNKYMDLLFGKSVTIENNKKHLNDKKIIKIDCKNNLEKKTDSFYNKINYNKNEYRWGDRKAIWIDYQFYSGGRLNPSIVYTNELIIIYCSIYFKDYVYNPIIGFSIKTKEGQTIYNTNSHLLSQDMSPYGKADSNLFINFKFINKLGPGDYFISLGIASMDKASIIPHDRRYDVIHFHVPSVDVFTGLFNLNLTIDAEL